MRKWRIKGFKSSEVNTQLMTFKYNAAHCKSNQTLYISGYFKTARAVL